MGRLAAPLAVALVCASAARAEVATVSAEGFVVTHDLVLEGTPERVYDAIVHEVGAWWNPDHSWSGDAANLTLDPTAGGCFCEQLADGGSVEHMRVVFASPGRLLRLTGGLGPLQGMNATGVMDFALEAEGERRTRLAFRYTAGGYTPDGLEALAEPVNGVLGGQLARLAGYLESGRPDSR